MITDGFLLGLTFSPIDGLPQLSRAVLASAARSSFVSAPDLLAMLNARGRLSAKISPRPTA